MMTKLMNVVVDQLLHRPLSINYCTGHCPVSEGFLYSLEGGPSCGSLNLLLVQR